jgi:hypothetical protein
MSSFQYGIHFGLIGGLQAMVGFLEVCMSYTTMNQQLTVSRTGIRLQSTEDSHRMEPYHRAAATDLFTHDRWGVPQLRRGRGCCKEIGTLAMSMASQLGVCGVEYHYDDHHIYCGSMRRQTTQRTRPWLLHDVIPAVNPGEQSVEVPWLVLIMLPVLHFIRRWRSICPRSS